MPTILVRSGPDFERNGVNVTPMAQVHYCEGCGVEGAPFIFDTGKTIESWCGRRPNGSGYCKADPSLTPMMHAALTHNGTGK